MLAAHARLVCRAALPQALLEPGDVIIIGSDGLWDNLWDEQVLAALADLVRPGQVRRDGGAHTRARRRRGGRGETAMAALMHA